MTKNSIKRINVKIGFCHHCAEKLQFDDRVFRNDTCPNCGSDVYCCLNCSDFDETFSNHCRESQAERVSVKDRRNFCEYFRLSETKKSSQAKDKAAEARRKLEEMFRK